MENYNEAKKLALLEAVTSGRISRREFASLGAGLGLSLAAFGSLSHTALADVPKKGGRLRLGITDSDANDTLDPATFASFSSYLITNGCVRNCLVEIDANSEVIPELAESWEPSQDAKSWRFKLRKGVQFHNGKSFTAADVIYSLNRHRGDTKSQAKSIMSSVTDIKSDDANTVVFTLSEGSADFPYLLSDARTQIVPEGTTNFDEGIGTGGYKLNEFQPGVQALLARNQNYWKQGRAHFDEVQILGINDATARMNSLLAGQLDVINRPDLLIYESLVKKPGIKGLEVAGPAYNTIPMRCDTPPFNDNNVRLAIKYSLDREALLQTILNGHGSVGNDHPISRSHPFFASELEQRAYDPDKATFYLKKAGLSSLSVPLYVAPGTWGAGDPINAALLYKDHAAKSGIDIQVERAATDGYWSDVWMKKPWCFSYWFGRPTADGTFTLNFSADSTQNESYWKNEKFNRLLVEARGQLNVDLRRQMYHEMQSILRDDGGSVIPLFNSDLVAYRDSLVSGPVATNAQLDGLKLPERWWFK